VSAGRLEEARRLQARLTPLARLIGGAHGVSALKAALDLAGYEGGFPRPPLMPANADLVSQLRQQFEAVGCS
jgi:4-hydroxy-2-oxoglutarate aldolase